MKPVQLGKNSIRFRKKKRMKFRRRNIPAARATVGRSPVIEIPSRNLDVENVQHNNRKKNTKHIHKSMNIKRRKKRVRIRFLKMTPVNETSKRVKDHGKKRVFFSLNHKKKTRNAAVPLLERRDVTIDGKPSETRSHWRRRSFKNAERKKNTR